jgi:ATP phosphoribosyltransferase regulatory subunit
MARLRAIDAGDALASRLDGLAEIAGALGGEVALTLDPTERHGFEYQSWLGFSLFAAGVRGEIGRGGTYAIVHGDSREEPAVGFSLYADAILASGIGGDGRRRLFLPLGTAAELGARLRREGWVTVAALDADDTPEGQLCSHVLRGGVPAEL